jgi:hypothetical protein
LVTLLLGFDPLERDTDRQTEWHPAGR